MKAILHVIEKNGSLRKVILAECSPETEHEVCDDSTGLHLQISSSGVTLLPSTRMSNAVKVPSQFLPAIWNVEHDLPVNDILAQLKRRGRVPSYQLEWGQWLVRDDDHSQMLFLQENSQGQPPFLQCLETLDSPQLAESCRQSLEIPRHQAISLGNSAVEAMLAGSYQDANGATVRWGEAVEQARKWKCSIPPDSPLPNFDTRRRHRITTVQVANQSTMAAARSLVENHRRPLLLNFANGIKPGGGFLSGARAQEECLCRSSALYATLTGDPMYAFHRSRPLPDASDWCILSQKVPYFRDDAGTPLPQPWLADVLTCAAPYAPTVGRQISRQLLKARILRVLSVAQAYSYETLVLGAWGCGAFGNDPYHTACDFRDALEGPFLGAFSHVTFAITDWSPERKFLAPFSEVFR